MNKIKLGIFFGLIAGIIDVVPMILRKLTWDANLSAFAFWIVSGFIIATTNIRLKGVLKGIVLSLILLIPVIFIVAWNDLSVLIAIIPFNIVLGAALGFFIDRYGKNTA